MVLPQKPADMTGVGLAWGIICDIYRTSKIRAYATISLHMNVYVIALQSSACTMTLVVTFL